jgi:hypothetical protein
LYSIVIVAIGIAVIGLGSRKRDTLADFYIALQQEPPQSPHRSPHDQAPQPALLSPNSAMNWGSP